MIENISKNSLVELIKTVFNWGTEDKNLAIFMDLPGGKTTDNDDWADTRSLAFQWFEMIKDGKDLIADDVELYCFQNVGANNGELPQKIYRVANPSKNMKVEDLDDIGVPLHLECVLKKLDVVIAPTFFSATAPLKVLAKKYNFRGATMPGFTRAMIPALSLDYEKVAKRVDVFANKMDQAAGFLCVLSAKGNEYKSYFDLRFRKAHRSTGLMREKKTVSNLPSGEAYIVPYEGENASEISKSEGVLPVQFGEEIVLYKIKNNKSFEVVGDGEEAKREREFLKEEPAYGNISEIGIGILGEFGVKACGSILLDEKLGLHIAFGRSEHFGGTVGPKSFNKPENVVHIDRVYVDSLQPDIEIKEASFVFEDGSKVDFRNL